ncbi:hypothetical protein [Thalassospira australica]|uniref:hypothetical protein n=1 Tax=Thalassospira australica TaxID=1528106 RepID=UPI00051A8907|nr:hypothetical protein [Thalassospira australica]
MNNSISFKRKLLVISQRPSDFVEMNRCALALHAKGCEIQFIYFHGNEHAEFELFDYLKEKFDDGTFSSVEIRRNGMSKSIKNKMLEKKSSFKESTTGKYLSRIWWERVWGPLRYRAECEENFILYRFVKLVKALDIIRFYVAEKAQLKKIISRLNPDAIILPEDVVGYNSPLLIKAGHELNIPSIILPYTIANEQEAFRSLAGNSHYHLNAPGNRTAGRLFPKWVKHANGLSLVRMPSPYIIGQVLTGTSPPNPWMMNSGFSNIIAVENDAMRDYYVSAGIPKTKIKVVGSVSDDHLAKFKLNKEQERLALKAELLIPGRKPLLVIGGCPDQSGSCPAGFEYKDFDDFVMRLAEALEPMKRYYDVIVRPHPNNMRMGELLSAFGIQSTEIDTARLVALSDAYVAFASATVRWAISCEVPVLNYDLFHYDYDDFKGIPGVLHATSYDEVKQGLESFIPSCEKFVDLNKEIKKSASRWGILDGHSTDRIAALIDQVCNYKVVPRTSA